MKITVKGKPKEIADLVVELQERQEINRNVITVKLDEENYNEMLDRAKKEAT